MTFLVIFDSLIIVVIQTTKYVSIYLETETFIGVTSGQDSQPNHVFFFLPDIPHLRPKPVYINTTRDNENIYSTKIPYIATRVVFIKWIVTFFLEKKYLTTPQNTKNGVDVLPKIMQVCHSYLFYLSYIITLTNIYQSIWLLGLLVLTGCWS